MKRILVPTDFSDAAEKAFRYALELAGVFGSEIVLLHVLDTRIVSNIYHIHQLPPEEAREEMRRQAERELEALLDGVPAGDLSVSVRTVEGIPVMAVGEVAEEIGADLIVIGRQGKTGLNHLLYGSTAEGLVRGAPCPVLTVNP